ncbi:MULTISPECIES: hypothetical protein [unclassified Brevundimonas]|uniref:hypothetical protein n=1 Tax=unclassified Brevundimonas TaxID=2622653 RepID=UPI000CFCAAF5|nr:MULTISPECIES: hypothetical protein [unclassified Brevundimonas]PRA36018.1 hypothetical protein CQ024_01390 [Brevundimonas sp. MYb27]PQZ84509.1 hypothetical protein CQ026_01570 [Brevundimonas sp. MYb31]PRB17744.1 hypothetical protein CQ039_01570 [Brevundimonas sp. MYb52]PRB38115.1 hypothetical protein CQ035_01570 [Brevundimonas sp. MYb46]PRB56103.1 hypothetical protein CQ028_01360 [Brevundimonas sp. MYb33]
MAHAPVDYTSHGHSDRNAPLSGLPTIVGGLMALVVMLLILATARLAYDHWLAGPAEQLAREAIQASNSVVVTSGH